MKRLLILPLLCLFSIGCAQDHATRAYELRAVYNEVLQDSKAFHDAQVINDATFNAIVTSADLVSPSLDELDRVADAEAKAKANGTPLDPSLAFNFEKIWNDTRPKVLALVVKVALAKQQKTKTVCLPIHRIYSPISKAA